MSVWALILIYGLDRSYPAIVIDNLESYEECQRVYKEISSRMNFRYGDSLCIQTRKAK